MKKILIFSLLFILSSTQAWAEFKVGVFDLEKVTAQSQVHKDQTSGLQQSFSKQSEELKSQEEELMDRYAKFSQATMGMKAEERSALNLDLMRASRMFEDKNIAFQHSYKEAQEKAQAEVLNVIREAAAELGRKQNYSLVVESDATGAFFVGKDVDVTPEMIREADRVWQKRQTASR